MKAKGEFRTGSAAADVVERVGTVLQVLISFIYLWLMLDLPNATPRLFLNFVTLLAIVAAIGWAYFVGPVAREARRAPAPKTLVDRAKRWLAAPAHRSAVATALFPTSGLVYGDSTVANWQPSRLALSLYCIALGVFSVYWSPLLGGTDPARMPRLRDRQAFALSTGVLWASALITMFWLIRQADASSVPR